MINQCKNDINRIAVINSDYAIVAQWQSTSLVMKRSGVQFPSIACAGNDENKRKTMRIPNTTANSHTPAIFWYLAVHSQKKYKKPHVGMLAYQHVVFYISSGACAMLSDAAHCLA